MRRWRRDYKVVTPMIAPWSPRPRGPRGPPSGAARMNAARSARPLACVMLRSGRVLPRRLQGPVKAPLHGLDPPRSKAVRLAGVVCGRSVSLPPRRLTKASWNERIRNGHWGVPIRTPQWHRLASSAGCCEAVVIRNAPTALVFRDCPVQGRVPAMRVGLRVGI